MIKGKMKLNRIQYIQSIFSLPINQEPQRNDIDSLVLLVGVLLIILAGMAGLHAIHVGLP